MSGLQDELMVLKYFAFFVLMPYGGGAALTMLPTLFLYGVPGARAYALVVAVFCLAAAASATLCAVLLNSGLLYIFFGGPLVVLPAIAGLWAAEYASRRFEPTGEPPSAGDA